MYSLAAADYLPVTFGSNQICAQYCPWVLRVLFHVEGLDLFRVVHDEYREIEMICDFRFMRRPEVFAPLDVIKAFFLEQFNRIRICDTRERRLNLFEDGSVTAECLKVEPAVLKYIRDKIFHIFLLNFEAVFMIVECHFRFNHPEFDQMSSRLRFFCTECGSERKD